MHSQQLQPQVAASRKQSLLRRDSRPENQYLQWIDLSGNSITREGAIALSRALCANKCLEELRPHQNNIGDDGAAALAHALVPNYSLLRLHLGNNGITEQCADSFAAARHERAAALAGRQLLDWPRWSAPGACSAVRGRSSPNDNYVGF